jgi:excinuclease ABC subunit C
MKQSTHSSLSSKTQSSFDQSQLDYLPQTPGVYLMYNHQEQIIYVGKAKNLKTRVKQYFAKTPDPRPFVSLLPQVLKRIQTMSTHNEKEALLLERSLILEHQPKHNVALKFGSGHLYLMLDPKDRWPRLYVRRLSQKHKLRDQKKHKYQFFGPYLSGSDLRAMLRVIESTFQIRTCDDRDFRNRSRPCLQYQIKRCMGPCVLKVDPNDYQDEVQAVIQLLRGKYPQLINGLQDKMRQASQQLAFEKAAHYRDQIQAIERSLIPQNVTFIKGDQDVIGLYREGDWVQIVVLEIRKGVLLKSHPFALEEQAAETEDLLNTFMHLYYSSVMVPPSEILLPLMPSHRYALELRLQEIKKSKVHCKIPQRGRFLQVLTMAQQNAEQSFFQAQKALQNREKTLIDLKKLCVLQQIPFHIECFDISIFQGEAPIASQVVFEYALPRKNKYRTYHIKNVQGTDDYAMLREALLRRLQRGITDNNLPQLLVIDGGKGQLNVAVSVLTDLELYGIDIISLAKARVIKTTDNTTVKHSHERIFIPGVKAAISLRIGSAIYRLLTYLRDEAHNTAIKAHRKQRIKHRLSSPLDEIPGIGMKRRKALLKRFGSLEGIFQASIADLHQVSGISEKLAANIYYHLHEKDT